MSVKIHGNWTNEFATEMVHEPSGAKLKTMAPEAAGGDGSQFSPIDLFAASVASCAVTAMNIRAREKGIEIVSVVFSVESDVAEAPRRVASLILKFDVRIRGADEDFDEIVQAGRKCPVKLALSAEIEVDETYTRLA